jgi:hypothetical protein
MIVLAEIFSPANTPRPLFSEGATINIGNIIRKDWA